MNCLLKFAGSDLLESKHSAAIQFIQQNPQLFNCFVVAKNSEAAGELEKRSALAYVNSINAIQADNLYSCPIYAETVLIV